MANRTIRTPEKRATFFTALRENAGNVSKACEAAGIGRMTVYEWRAAEADFASEWDNVVEESTDALEQEVYRRAHDGVEEPVFYQGEVCGTVRKYSDTLAMFTLKARRPDIYRENIRTELTGKDGGPIRIAKAEDLSDDELAAIASSRQ